MRFFCKSIATNATLTAFLLGLSLSGLAQSQAVDRPGIGGPSASHSIAGNDLRKSAQGHYPGPPVGGSPFAPAETNFDTVFDTVRRQHEQSATTRT